MPTSTHRFANLSETNKGLIYAATGYLIWGFFPLYWYPLTHSAISAPQMLAQRIIWSTLFMLTLTLLLGKGKILLQAVRNPRLFISTVGSSLALSINWLVWLWAIVNNHVLDASLGYFILPLFSIFLGWLLFKERLNRLQQLAILFALAGILWLAVPAGKIPWVAIILTLSFGLYGFMHKIASLPTLPGITLETLIMTPFALAYLYWVNSNDELIFTQLPTLPFVLLIASGAVTTFPLLFFANGAKRITLTHLGMLQYLTPSLQFLLGLVLFAENFNTMLFIGYLLVWCGVAIYLFSIIKKRKKSGIN